MLRAEHVAVSWGKDDVPTVEADELVVAARMWLAEAHRGPVAIAAVAGRQVDPGHALERRIADAYGRDTERSLAIILRLRCLVAAFALRRFETRVKGGDDAWLIAAAAAAARIRVNADIGFSPVRLAWAIVVEEQALAAMKSGAIAA